MGRRKIEIQPITHERNRSVTFLKRKNGLFKKAYELGVLCSVDVAVIIFEERPGHHVKLYQYCSKDIQDVVQRHMRYDGEKDTRGPDDFNNNPTKLDDVGEGDEEEAEEDDAQDLRPVVGSNRKSSMSGGGGSGKTSADYGGKMAGNSGLSLDTNMGYQHGPMSIPPPPMPLHRSTHLSPSSSQVGSILPVSGERLTPAGASISALSRAQQQQALHQSGSNKRPRLAPTPDSDNSSSYGYQQSGSGSSYRHPQHHSSQSQSQSQSHQFNPFIGLASAPPPPSFLSGLPFDFPPASRTQQSMQQARISYPARYPIDQYGSLVRSQPPPVPPADLFAAFLDADEHRQAQAQAASQAGFGSLDWPVHNSIQQPQQQQRQQQRQQQPPTPQDSGPPASSSPSSPSWLDFLTGSAPPPSGSASSTDDRAMSWERGTRDRSGSHSMGSPALNTNKRPRTSSSSGIKTEMLGNDDISQMTPGETGDEGSPSGQMFTTNGQDQQMADNDGGGGGDKGHE